jgi:hypothetical protein
MIQYQCNGYRDIQVTKTPEGIKVASVTDYHDGTVKEHECVLLPEVDRLVLVAAFGAGSFKQHTKTWSLSEGRLLSIHGWDCGNSGDWDIWQGRDLLLRGSGNFKGLTEALINFNETSS